MVSFPLQNLGRESWGLEEMERKEIGRPESRGSFSLVLLASRGALGGACSWVD